MSLRALAAYVDGNMVGKYSLMILIAMLCLDVERTSSDSGDL
jgi:hypothetical protein